MQKTPSINDYLRPLKLSIALSVFGEAIILIVWGLILYPEGSLFTKFMWTIVYCGIGMGATVGAFISLFLIGRFSGATAITLTVFISVVTLGFLCNYLCFNLSSNFDLFGGGSAPKAFMWNGVIMAAVGGVLIGWLIFTDRGKKLLDRYGL